MTETVTGIVTMTAMLVIFVFLFGFLCKWPALMLHVLLSDSTPLAHHVPPAMPLRNRTAEPQYALPPSVTSTAFAVQIRSGHASKISRR